MKMIRLGIVAVLVHLGISLAHGYAHTQLGVGLSTWQNLYVMIVITLAPLIAVFLLWMARGWLGFIVLTVSMAGAFIFGGRCTRSLSSNRGTPVSDRIVRLYCWPHRVAKYACNLSSPQTTRTFEPIVNRESQ
jgi:hypothetical protein